MQQAESIDSIERLEDLLSEPTEAVIETFGKRDGDVILLGAGGKIGPTLARMAQRACSAAGGRRRVIAVSRFSDSALPDRLRACGVETISCDLLDETAIDRLPDASDVIYLAGMKFGSTDQMARTWAMNTLPAASACRKYRRSRIVAFSTGNVYGLTPVVGGGSRESDPLDPTGEYAMSCLGRERIFDYFSRQFSTPVALLPLNYACELRYGVLVDLARQVAEGKTVPLDMGYLNTIWQGDVNAMTLLAFKQASAPATVLNLTGPELLSVRKLATQFGERLSKSVTFSGLEAPTAILSNARRALDLYGAPRVSASQLAHWVAHWVQHGGASLGKPTHFEVRDGQY